MNLKILSHRIITWTPNVAVLVPFQGMHGGLEFILPAATSTADWAQWLCTSQRMLYGRLNSDPRIQDVTRSALLYRHHCKFRLAV